MMSILWYKSIVEIECPMIIYPIIDGYTLYIYIYTLYIYIHPIYIYTPYIYMVPSSVSPPPPHGLGPQVVAPIPFYLQAIGSISEVQRRIC